MKLSKENPRWARCETHHPEVSNQGLTRARHMEVSRAVIAGLVVASAILSGCTARAPAASTADFEADADAPDALALPWTLDACRFVAWFVPVDATALQAHLPEGFGPVGFGTARGGVTIPGAYLGFEAFACDSGSGVAGSVSGLRYGSLFTSVRTLADAGDSGPSEASDHFYFKWSPLVPDESRRAWLQTEGADVSSGEAEPGAVVTPAGTIVRTTLALHGVGNFALTGGPARESPVNEQGSFIEHSRTDRGLAVWTSDYVLTSVASGVGTFEVEAGSWPHALIGVDRGTSQFVTGTSSFMAGRVTLPVHARDL